MQRIASRVPSRMGWQRLCPVLPTAGCDIRRCGPSTERRRKMETVTNMLDTKRMPGSYPPLPRFRSPGACGLLAFSVLVLLGSASRAVAKCDPGANEVAFFQDSGFGGKCAIRGLGDYPHSVDTGLANDSISSIKVGASVQALVCAD